MSVFIDEDANNLRITVPWQQSIIRRVVASAFSLFVCCLFTAMAISLAITPEHRSIVGSGISTLLACAGMYLLGSIWFNRTILDVDRRRIRVFTKPFPLWRFPATTSVEVTDIRQVFVQHIEHWAHSTKGSSEAASFGADQKFLGFSYSVNALLKDGSNFEVVDFTKITRWTSDDKAVDVEERIESFLGIDDIPVQAAPIKMFHHFHRKC